MLFKIMELEHGQSQLCIKCKRDIEIIKEGELCAQVGSEKNIKYLHWMCVNQGYIRKLDDSIIFNLTISDENKTRVAEAYKKGAVEETKKDEPMYNQHAQADVNWVEQLKRKYLNNTSVQPTPPSTEMETDEPESSAMAMKRESTESLEKSTTKKSRR